MRLIKPLLVLLTLLALVACGTPTDNFASDTGTTGQYNASAAAEPAPSQAAEASAAPADTSASAAPNPAGGTANTAARNNQYSAPPEQTIDPAKRYTATIETTDGTMVAELFASEAPKTVNNFVFLARDGYYDGIRFHRIIKDFMVQTGDPLGTGTGGPGYEFEDEPVTRDYLRGTLAMANRGPDTNGSQFFIVHQDSGLPKDYTIFGQLTEGEDVLDAIANTPTTGPEGSTPTEEVVITKITITEE